MSRTTRSIHFICLLLVTLLFVPRGHCQSWTGFGGTAWESKGNWSPEHIPGSGPNGDFDVASIGSAALVTHTLGPRRLGAIILSGGSQLQSAQGLTVQQIQISGGASLWMYNYAPLLATDAISISNGDVLLQFGSISVAESNPNSFISIHNGGIYGAGGINGKVLISSTGSIVASGSEYLSLHSQARVIENNGTISAAAGGHLLLNGTVDNRNGRIFVDTAGRISGGARILGGVLESLAQDELQAGRFTLGMRLEGNPIDPVILRGNFEMADGQLSGSIVNHGRISGVPDVNGQYASLYFGANTELSGGGRIVLPGSLATLAGSPLVTVNQSQHSIEGAGQIGGNLIINNLAGGAIEANKANQTLFVNYNTQSGLNPINQGAYWALNGGRLVVSTQSHDPYPIFRGLDNEGGYIFADRDSIVELNINVRGGTLSSFKDNQNPNRSGLIRVGGYLDGRTATIQNFAEITSGTTANSNARISLLGEIVNSGRLSGNLQIQGDTLIRGGGQIGSRTDSQALNINTTRSYQVKFNNDSLIRGYGNITGTFLAIENGAPGEIRADIANRELYIANRYMQNKGIMLATQSGLLTMTTISDGAFWNDGTMRATNGGLIRIAPVSGTAYNNYTGVIEAAGTGKIEIPTWISANRLVNWGTIRAIDGGVVDLSSLAGLSNGLLDKGRYEVIGANSRLFLASQITELNASLMLSEASVGGSAAVIDKSTGLSAIRNLNTIHANGSLQLDAGVVVSLGSLQNYGDLTLSGGSSLNVSNTFTQSSGRLILQDTDSRLTAGRLVLNGGSVSGTGSIESAEIELNRGRIQPGNSPGLMELIGNVTIGNESILEIELGGTEPGQFDQLFVIGDLNLAGTLDVSLLPNFQLQANQHFEIINVSGILNGSFSQLDEGDWVGRFGNTDLYITYSFGGGNSVALFTAVPEPSSLMLVMLGCMIANTRRWERKKVTQSQQ